MLFIKIFNEQKIESYFFVSVSLILFSFRDDFFLRQKKNTQIDLNRVQI